MIYLNMMRMVCDSTYTIDQETRNVSVINMVAANTIEHNMLRVIGFKKSMAEGVLDNGDGTIFMGDDRFKKFMESVENMVGGSMVQEVHSVTDETEEKETAPVMPGLVEEPVSSTKPDMIQQTLFGDDDVPVPVSGEPRTKQGDTSSDDLITMGVSFFSKLTETLSNPESTRALAKSLVKQDENGKTYIKIPVENEKVVENAMMLILGLLKNMKIQLQEAFQKL